MEYKCNKQYWLENVLKKLYKKVQSLEKVKSGNHWRRNLKVSLANANVHKNQKMKKFQRKGKVIKYQFVTHHIKQKSFQKIPFKKHTEKKSSNPETEKFWKFVDTFLQSRSYLQRNKNALFIPVIPPTINNTLLKSTRNSLTLRSRIISRHISNKSTLPGDYGEGNTLSLRSRIISRHTSNESTLPGDCGEESGLLVSNHSACFWRSEINANGSRKALAQKIFLTIQKARMKKATDVITKEVLGERKAKKA